MGMQLDLLEEECDIPTASVEFCEGEGLVSYVVGQKSVNLPIGKVLIGGQPKFFEIVSGGPVGCQFDDFISQKVVFINGTGNKEVVFDIVLGPCHEKVLFQ